MKTVTNIIKNALLFDQNYQTTSMIRDFLHDKEVMDTYRVCLHCHIRGTCKKDECSIFASLNHDQKILLTKLNALDRELLQPILTLLPEEKEDLMYALDYPMYQDKSK